MTTSDLQKIVDNELRLKTETKLLGNDGQYHADVILKNGKNAVVTDTTVTIEQIFGFDDFADTWFKILTAGDSGDTWRIEIAASSFDTTTPDSDIPATDLTFTVTSTEAGNEIKVRDAIISMLNANATFNQHWKASAIKDNAIVHISSKYLGEKGDRSGATDFTVTVSGTATMSYLNSDNRQIKRRGKQTSGARDARDKRLVTVGISGEVNSLPGAIGDLYIENALHATHGANLLQNGSLATPIEFAVNSDSSKDIFIQEIRFYGNANGIKFGQFLSTATLTNGILVEIKSDDIVTTLPVVKTTDDLKHKVSFGPQGFQLHVQAGRDDFTASFTFATTFPIRKSGTFLTDDYIKVKVRDNLTAATLLVLEFIVFGFQKEV